MPIKPFPYSDSPTFNRRSWLSASVAAMGNGLIASLDRSLSAADRPKNLAGFSGIELAIATICTDGFGNQHREPAMEFTGAKRGTQGGLDAIIEVCKEIAPAAEELGVLVTLENHAGNNLETIEDYDKVFSAIASPNIGLCLDSGHFEGVGIRLSDVIERLHSRTLHVDLKDCREFGKGHATVPFGEGITDFDAFLTQLTATGYQGYLVIEQAWNEPQGDWKRDLKAARERFRKWETKSACR